IAVAVTPLAVLLDDPRGEADRGIVQRISERLRFGALDLGVRALIAPEPRLVFQSNLFPGETRVGVLRIGRRPVAPVQMKTRLVAPMGARQDRPPRTPEVTCRDAIPRVSEAPHQPDEDPAGALAGMPHAVRPLGETVARQRHDDPVEGALGTPAMAARVGELF